VLYEFIKFKMLAVNLFLTYVSRKRIVVIKPAVIMVPDIKYVDTKLL